MMRGISTDCHAICFRPKISRIFSENGEASKWCRITWDVMAGSQTKGRERQGSEHRPRAEEPSTVGPRHTLCPHPEERALARVSKDGGSLRPILRDAAKRPLLRMRAETWRRCPQYSVARMERSEIRDRVALDMGRIALAHPGYEKSSRRSRTCECIRYPRPPTSLILLASCPVRVAF